MSTESVRARIAAATPGPWVTCGCDHPSHDQDCPNGRRNDVVERSCNAAPSEVVHAYHKHVGGAVFTEADVDPYRTQNMEDFEFIAHARTDLDLALDVIEAAKALYDSPMMVAILNARQGGKTDAKERDDRLRLALDAFERSP